LGEKISAESGVEQKLTAQGKVTRFGKFLPLRQLLTLGSFLITNSTLNLAMFSTVKVI
jgi:hypothetical protein